MRSRSYCRWRVAFWAGLGVCVSLGVVWVASIGWYFNVVVDRHNWLAQIAFGNLSIIAFQGPFVGPRFYWGPLDWSEYVQYWRPHFRSNSAFRIVEVPLWMLAMLAAAPTAFARWRTRSRARAGCCAGCGYSLSGLPAGAPCPECGHTAAM